MHKTWRLYARWTKSVTKDKYCKIPLTWGLYVRMLSRFSRVRLFGTPWTVAHQTPLSVGFFRQEYWSGLPCPPPGDVSDPGIKPTSLMSPALASRFFTSSATWEAPYEITRGVTFRDRKQVVVAVGWGAERAGASCLMGRVTVWEDRKVWSWMMLMAIEQCECT